MSRAAVSVLAWGIYLIGAGLGFLLTPNLVLPIFGLPTTTEVWVRVVGLLAAIIGMYYVSCARGNVVPFFRLTVTGRLLFMAGSVALVALGLSSPSFLLIGALDTIGAIWTWLSLRATTEAGTAAVQA
jgi:hypothetical protein